MHIATSYTYNSPEFTKYLVIGVSSFLAVALGTYFFVSFRRNQRGSAGMGPLTPSEKRLNRQHAVAILFVLFGSMALAVGAVVSPEVQDVLSKVGDQGSRLPLLAIPLVLVYARWLSRRMQVIAAERAALASGAGR